METPFSEQAPQESRESPRGDDGRATETPEIKTGVALVDLKEEVTLKKPAMEERASDLREIEEYFLALELDLDCQQQLLREQREEHRMQLIALERERLQERMEWEREWREREEAMLSTLMSVVVSREKLMNDIRSRPTSLVSIEHLAAVSKEGKPRRWWYFKKHQATPDAPPQDAHSSSSTKASTDTKADEFNLQELIELEKRIRKAEAKKLLEAQAKAERKARKAENSGRARGIRWLRCLVTMGCTTSASED